MARVELESQGHAVNVNLLYTVEKGQVAFVDGWLGVTSETGVSGDVSTLTVDQREYRWRIPSSLSVTKGAIVYIDTTVVTGHTPGDAAYFTASGANKRALFRASSAHYTGADGNRYVDGIMLMGV